MTSSGLRVAFLEPFPAELVEHVRSAFETAGFAVYAVTDRSAEARRQALSDADYAVVVNAPLAGADLPSGGRLRMVQKWGAGYDNVDRAALASRGIPLLRTSGTNADYVAELALALILSTRRNLFAAAAVLRTGGWDALGHWTQSSTLMGKTVGLVGFGAVAQALARLLGPFRCTVLYTAKRSRAEAEPSSGPRSVPLHTLLEASDVVSLHVPLTAETRGLIGADELLRMRREAILVNTSRGAVVDEKALAAALASGVIAGAGLDVFEQEPLPADHPWRTSDKVTLTPHIGGKVRENFAAVVAHIVSNISGHMAGSPLPRADIVAPPA